MLSLLVGEKEENINIAGRNPDGDGCGDSDSHLAFTNEGAQDGRRGREREVVMEDGDAGVG